MIGEIAEDRRIFLSAIGYLLFADGPKAPAQE
jgi:hypothetical protein